MKKDKKLRLKSVKQAAKDSIKSRLTIEITNIVAELGQDADKFKKIINKEVVKLAKKLANNIKFSKHEKVATVVLSPPVPVEAENDPSGKAKKKSVLKTKSATTEVEA